MTERKGTMPGQGEAGLAEVEVEGEPEAHSPRKMTFAENVALTIKLLVGFALLGGALWGINLWKEAR